MKVMKGWRREAGKEHTLVMKDMNRLPSFPARFPGRNRLFLSLLGLTVVAEEVVRQVTGLDTGTAKVELRK